MSDDLDAPVTRRELLAMLPNLHSLATKSDVQGLDKSLFSHMAEHPKATDPAQLARIEQRVNDFNGQVQSLKRKQEALEKLRGNPEKLEAIEAILKTIEVNLQNVQPRLTKVEADADEALFIGREIGIRGLPSIIKVILQDPDQVTPSCHWDRCEERPESAFAALGLAGQTWRYIGMRFTCPAHFWDIAYFFSESADYRWAMMQSPPHPRKHPAIIGPLAPAFIGAVRRNPESPWHRFLPPERA